MTFIGCVDSSGINERTSTMTLNDVYETDLKQLLTKCNITKCDIITNPESGEIVKFIMEYVPAIRVTPTKSTRNDICF